MGHDPNIPNTAWRPWPKSKIPRNDLCPCGSHRKYKKCCINRDPLVLSPEGQDGMRKACQFQKALIRFLEREVVEGVTTLDLDQLAYEFTMDYGHTPACLGYRGYGHTICASVNDVVAHGVPNDIPLKPGDILNLDGGTIVDGWHGDFGDMVVIGEIDEHTERLVRVAKECLDLGIKALVPNDVINEAAVAIQKHAEGANGFSVVREYTGHGIGREFHQHPTILHFSSPSNMVSIPPGYCFTLEPMINAGRWETVVDPDDGWTVRTKDGSLSAQCEHTILMTEDGPEVLTK